MIRWRPSAEDIAWIGLMAASVVLIACVLWLAPALSHLYPGPTYRLFPEWQSVARPEPLEATRDLLALAVPFVLAAAVLLGSPRPASRRFDLAVIALQIAGAGLIAWAVVEQFDGPVVLFPPNYFRPLLLGAPVLIGGVLIGFLLSCIALARKSPFKRLHVPAGASLAGKRGAPGAALALTALWLLPAIVTDGNVASSGAISSGHIPIQAQDYFAVVNGHTPLVNYVPQYVSLLPLLFAPLLAAFDLSLASFSVLMTVLSLVALLALFGALYQVTERPWAALALYVPLLAISLFPWSSHGPASEFNGNYHGFFPGRYLGPFVVAFLLAVAVRRQRLPVWLLFLVAGLAAANNAEFGIACVLALAVALLIGCDRAKGLGRSIRALVGQAAIGLVAAVVIVCVVILARSGQLPDPSLLTYYSGVFAREGFGLVPMPTLGLHIPIYLTYVGAILTAAVRSAQGRPGRTLTVMLAYAGTFGLLSLLYFGGRSLPWQLMLLFPDWGLALALLAWTAGLSLSVAYTDGRIFPSRRFLPSLAAMCGFGVMVAAIGTFPLPWSSWERISEAGRPVDDLPRLQRFVDTHVSPGESILLYGTVVDFRVAQRAGVRNASPWYGWPSLLSRRDVLRALDLLKEAKGSKVFLDRVGVLHAPLTDKGAVPRILRARHFKQVAGSHRSPFALFSLGGR